MDGFLTDNGTQLTMEHFYRRSVMRHTHTHPQYELYFCPQKVTQVSIINGVKYEYNYPCVILSAPFTVHSMSCGDPREERYERYVFYFTDQFLNAMDEHLLPSFMRSTDTSLLFALTEGQAAFLKRILDLCESESALAQRELTLALFLNKLAEVCPMENTVQVGASASYIRSVLQYVASNFCDIVDSDDIAKRFAVSRSKLDRDFKRFTGMTVHGFLDICRLNQAKYLLQFHRELPVGTVSERCGFESETYFFPFFKKHVGQTPVAFRKQTEGRSGQVMDPERDRNRCGDE